MTDLEELLVTLIVGAIVTVVFITTSETVCGIMEEGQLFYGTCQTVAELGLTALLMIGVVSAITIVIVLWGLLESGRGRR